MSYVWSQEVIINYKLHTDFVVAEWTRIGCM